VLAYRYQKILCFSNQAVQAATPVHRHSFNTSSVTAAHSLLFAAVSLVVAFFFLL
jgi:hypothetical protein